ncbi:MAG: hypothetical protein ACLQBB_15465 [Solirubrobacteraceae bacterium]
MSLIRSAALRRFSKGAPIGWMLLAGDLALLTGRHVGRLDGEERRRLAALLGAAAKRRGSLEPSEREELGALLAKFQPRLLFGTAARRASPLPLPSRLLYGRRGSPARKAARRRA